MQKDDKGTGAFVDALARRSESEVAALRAKESSSFRKGWLAIGLSFALALMPLAAGSVWLTPALVGAGGLFLFGAKEFIDGARAGRNVPIAVLAASLSRNIDDSQIQDLGLSLSGTEHDVGVVAGWAQRVERDAERKGISPTFRGRRGF